MVSHHPVKFGGHRHCDSGDMTVLVTEGQDALALKNMACHDQTRRISEAGATIC